MKSRPERILWDEYLRRITWPVTLHEVEERKALEPKILIAREAELLSRAIPRGAFVVALDKSGKAFSSRSFAQLFQDWIDEKRKYITFIIVRLSVAWNQLEDSFIISQSRSQLA